MFMPPGVGSHDRNWKQSRTVTSFLGLGPVSQGLSFEATLPRGLVHRRFVADVLLTDGRRESDESFTVGAQWPRTHVFYRQEAGAVDSAVVAETLRQATIYLAHQFFGVPFDSHLVMSGMRFTLDGRPLTVGLAPVEVVLHVSIDGVRRGSTGLTAMKTSVAFWHGNRVIARGEGDLTVLSAKVYARVRAATAFADVGQRPVAVRAPGPDRVLATGMVGVWRLLVDLTDPVFFDHPIDHVPGMLIVEAVRQIARQTSGFLDGDLSRFSANFARYLELTEETLLTVISQALVNPHQLDLVVRVAQGSTTGATVTATVNAAETSDSASAISTSRVPAQSQRADLSTSATDPPAPTPAESRSTFLQRVAEDPFDSSEYLTPSARL
jgi:hypothetical protein